MAPLPIVVVAPCANSPFVVARNIFHYFSCNKFDIKFPEPNALLRCVLIDTYCVGVSAKLSTKLNFN